MKNIDESDLSRREFLSRAGITFAAAAASVSVSTSLPAQDMTTSTAETIPEEKKVGWAIAGLGVFATGPILKNIRHCRNTRVTGLVTRDPDGKGQKFATQYGVAPDAVVNLENISRLADRKDIEVVYVITPNALHKPYVLAALAAGKHVFCEKPFAPTVADCQEMVDAAEKAGRRIGLGYRVRFDPHNIRAIQAIRNGDLGKVKLISGEFGFNVDTSKPHGAWRCMKALSGGGSLPDIGVYGINAARFLTGEEPTHVSGQIHSTEGDPRFVDVEETVLFQFAFPSGVRFQAISSYGIAGVNRFRAVGDKGWLDLEPAISYEGAQMTLHKEGGRRKLPAEEHNMFAAMMDDFSDAVREGREARSTGMDGLRDVRCIEAIYESAAAGGKIVTL